MKNIVRYTLIILLAIALVITLFALYLNNINTLNSSKTSNQSNFTPVLFNNSQYVSYAYMLYPKKEVYTISTNAKIATSDFNYSFQDLTNGSVNLTLKFVDTHAVYSIILNRNYKFYYLDKNLADDNPTSDTSNNDDGYLIVNTTGYITFIRYPIPGV